MPTKRRWAGDSDRDPSGDGDDTGANTGWTGAGGAGKKSGRTGMRMSWQGPGHRLSVMLWVLFSSHWHFKVSTDMRALGKTIRKVP